MLNIIIPEQDDLYDEVNNLFIYRPGGILKFEHSLLSIAEWEAKYHVPFLSSEKTDEQLQYYIECMLLNKENLELLKFLTQDDVTKIANYMNDIRTATTVKEKKGGSRRIVTSELIYYWMVALNIPFECEQWHINRLITLINVCDAENQPQKKMSKQELLSRNKSLNEARRKAMKSSG